MSIEVDWGESGSGEGGELIAYAAVFFYHDIDEPVVAYLSDLFASQPLDFFGGGA